MENKEIKWTDFSAEQYAWIIKQYQTWLEKESEPVIELINKRKEDRKSKKNSIIFALKNARDNEEYSLILNRLIRDSMQCEHDASILSDLKQQGLIKNTNVSSDIDQFLNLCSKIDYDKPIESCDQEYKNKINDHMNSSYVKENASSEINRQINDSGTNEGMRQFLMMCKEHDQAQLLIK